MPCPAGPCLISCTGAWSEGRQRQADPSRRPTAARHRDSGLRLPGRSRWVGTADWHSQATGTEPYWQTDSELDASELRAPRSWGIRVGVIAGNDPIPELCIGRNSL